MNEILNNSLTPSHRITEAGVCINMRELIHRIESLPSEQQLQIFQIIQNDSARFTQNQNGVFVNLTNTPTNTIEKIHKLVCSVENRNTFIKQSQATLDNNNDCENTIQTSFLSSPTHASTEPQNVTVSHIFQSLNTVEKKAIGTSVSKISRRKNLQLQSQQKSKPENVNRRLTKLCTQQTNNVSSSTTPHSNEDEI
jgi:hypothetical protein